MPRTPHTNFRLDATTRQLLRELADWHGNTLTNAVSAAIRAAHRRMVRERAAQTEAERRLAPDPKKSQEGA